MKVLVTSDWHLDWSTAGMPRFDDVCRAIDGMLEAHLSEIGLFLFLGDLTDPSSPRAWRAIEYAARCARAISAVVPSVWLAGNHDHVNDGHGTTTLDSLVYARADALIYVVQGYEVITVDGINLELLAHPGKGRAYDPAEMMKASKANPAIIAAHLTLQGYDRGSESEDMPRGKEVPFPYEEIDRRNLNAVLLCGHHHKRGIFRWSSNRLVNVPGSLVRLTFNEEHNTPGYLLLEI